MEAVEYAIQNALAYMGTKHEDCEEGTAHCGCVLAQLCRDLDNALDLIKAATTQEVNDG